jgi:hypothetical protein
VSTPPPYDYSNQGFGQQPGYGQPQQPPAYGQPQQPAYGQPGYDPNYSGYGVPPASTPAPDPSAYGGYGASAPGYGAYPAGPGYPGVPVGYGVPPLPRGSVPTYMWQSVTLTIVSFLTCNWHATVLGIVGIVFGNKVNGALDRGDAAAAASSSRVAKIVDIVSLVLLLLGVVLIGVWIAIIAAGGAFSTSYSTSS